MQFKDKVAIVTGGASGIGLATVKRLLLEGAKVVIGDVSKDLDDIVKNLGKNVIGVHTDVSNESDVINLIDKTVSAFGRIDYMVANAGIGGSSNKLCDVSMEEWQNVIGINQTGIYLCNKYAIKSMLKTGGGAIVNTTSMTIRQYSLRAFPCLDTFLLRQNCPHLAAMYFRVIFAF